MDAHPSVSSNQVSMMQAKFTCSSMVNSRMIRMMDFIIDQYGTIMQQVHIEGAAI